MPSKSSISKPKAKAATSAKTPAKAPKKNQLLISRFFSSSSRQSKPTKPPKPTPTSHHEDQDTLPPPSPTGSTEPINVDCAEPVSKSTKSTILKPLPASTPTTHAMHSQSPESQTQPAAEPEPQSDPQPDQPSLPPSQPDSQANLPVTRASSRAAAAVARRAAPRRRLFVDVDADDESGSDEPPQKRRRADDNDPDFNMGDASDHDGHEDDEPDTKVVADVDIDLNGASTALDELRDDDTNDMDGSTSDGPEAIKNRPNISDRRNTTLADYTSVRVEPGRADAPTPPRDDARRKKFSQKIGRLEKNSFFLRRTGGSGVPGETEEDKSNAKTKRGKSVSYTPLETQFVRLREQHPGMLLVVECGYKYRMFDQDAVTASRVLRVASFFDHNFMTAGFPTHRLGHHVSKLVEAGFKVGVVSQSETAALKKAGENASKLFQRKLSAVYTKGTIAADGKLAAPASKGIALTKSATYIMAVCEVNADHEDDSDNSDKRTITIAAVDSATGEVFYDSFTDDVLRPDLESRLVAIEPVEVLVPETLMSSPTEQVVKAFCESMSARLERMRDSDFDAHDDVEGMRETVLKNKDVPSKSREVVLTCLGALVNYLKQFRLELSMTSVMEYKSFRSSRQMRIGADVLRNFEVFGNSNNGAVDGSLIGLVNRTHTAFGGRQMRQWVSHPLMNAYDISDRLDAVDYLRKVIKGGDHVVSGEPIDIALSELIASFSKLPDLEQGLTRISCRKCSPAELIRVLEAVEGVGKKIDHIKSLDPSGSFTGLLKKMFSATPTVTAVLENDIVEILNRTAAVEDKYPELFEQNEDLSSALTNVESADEFLEVASELEEANSEAKSAAKAMTKLLKKLREQHSFPRWEWKKVANEEYLLEVPVNKASKMPSSWVIVNQTKAVKRYRPGETVSGHERVLCARETQEAIASRCWQAYLKLFSSIASSLRAVVRLLVDLDCLAALAQVANLPGYCKPVIETDEEIPSGIHATNARHPLTELLPSCKSYVPNDVALGGGQDHLAMVISGPNYGGKSSYARMTALLVILGQIGCFVPAGSMKLSPFDAIHARMGSSDCMAKGMSSLMVELAETSRILSTATPRSLVILDELGRGTSTHDGAAIAYATLSHFVTQTSCVTLFVTHYPMLASLRIVYPALVKACFMNYMEESTNGAKVDDDTGQKRNTKITFLYKLADGVASSSYGLNVARLAGISNGVIDNAQCKADEMEKKLETVKREGVWSQLLHEYAWKSTGTASKLLQLAQKQQRPLTTK